jgi:hypothetical protein
MFSAALLMMALFAGQVSPHGSAHIQATHPHPSVRLTTGTLAQVCTNASRFDRLFGKRDECSLVDPQGTTPERAYHQACARHGTTGRLDCHIGYTFKYVTVRDHAGGQLTARFRGCARFLADVRRAEDARRSEQIPMVFGAVQAERSRPRRPGWTWMLHPSPPAAPTGSSGSSSGRGSSIAIRRPLAHIRSSETWMMHRRSSIP